jgi:N,N'-diacetylchitobiose transport system permease protein
LGFFEGFAWLNSALSAFVAIWVVIVWQSFPFVALSLLAGLQSIPPEVIEAAKLDGATAAQRLRLVILPMLKPLILVLVVISTIWDFKIFDQVYVMTGGGPAQSTEVIAIATWREAFTQLDFGLGSALAMTLFVVLALVTAFYVRLIREEELA